MLSSEIWYVILSKLVHLEVATGGIIKIWGDCYQIKVCLQILGNILSFTLLSLHLNAIQWVHDTLVWESFLYQFKVFITSERDMIDLIREVKRDSLHHEVHDNILVGVRRYVEISWDSVDLKVTFDVAALLLFDFLFDTIQ